MRHDTTDAYSATLRITDRRDLESNLDHAVADAIQRALVNPGKGILVTRHDHETFTIELTDRVEAGLIREADARN